MSDKAFVDTNILVYAHDQASGMKNERARALLEKLWETGSGMVSTQVLQELCVSLERRVARPWAMDETRSLIEDYLSWEIVISTPASVVEALMIANTNKISFWDALILQAAENCGAAILYSEDFSDGQLYGTVRVVNPLSQSFSA